MRWWYMTIEIGILIAIIGCFVGLGGWLKGRDSKIATDAEWKGNVNAKLDVIVGIKENVEKIENKFNEHDRKITALEEYTKSAHHRLDEMAVRKNEKD
jgi:hypothetical protein